MVRTRSFALYFSLSFLLLVACQTAPSDLATRVLSKAEAVIEQSPDSAYQLLKSIPRPEELSGKNQADYCLLLTQVWDKKYLKHGSDSLIKIAVNYYTSQSEDWVKRGKSFLYYGRVMKELEQPKEAMEYHLKAKRIFETSKEYKMLGLIFDGIGVLNWNQDLPCEVLFNCRTALHYYTLAQDSVCMSYALRNIGRYYLSIEERMDSSYYYYQKALLVVKNRQSSSEASILQELGILHRSNGNYKKSEYYFLRVLKLNKNASSFPEIYLSLAYNYLLMNDIERSELYLKKCIAESNILTTTDAYYLYAELEQMRKDPWKALAYKAKSDSVNSIIQRSEIKEAVANMQQKYENEKLVVENLRLKVCIRNFILLGLFLFFPFIFVGFYFYGIRRQFDKRKCEIEREITKNRAEMALCREEVAQCRQRESESENYRNQLGELRGKIEVLEKMNLGLKVRLAVLGKESLGDSYSKTDKGYISTFCLLLSLRSASRKGELFRPDWEEVLAFFHYFYGSVPLRLQNRAVLPLTKHNLLICCLLKFGFNNENLRRAFLTTPDAVTKAKGRIKKQLNLSVETDLDEYLRNF